QVELALMRSGEHDVARAYVLYREKRAQERAVAAEVQAQHGEINVVVDGERRVLDIAGLQELIISACQGLTDYVDTEAILKETIKNLYDGVSIEEVHKSAILAARALIEKDPAYSQV